MKTTMKKNDPRHGTPNGYGNRGCRCNKCRAAWAKYYHAWLHAKPIRVKLHNARRMEYYYRTKSPNKAAKVVATMSFVARHTRRTNA